MFGVELFVVFLNHSFSKSGSIIKALTESEVNFLYDASDNPVGIRMKDAEANRPRYIMFVDQNGIYEGLYGVRNQLTGETSKHSLERIISMVKDYRK